MPTADAMTPATTYRRRKEVLTADHARELLSYDPETGVLSWRVRRRRVAPGAVAGSLRGDGYLCVTVGGRAYLAHRLCWLLFHGRWPERRLDHRNNLRDDNRLDNLRLATAAQNVINRRSGRRPASGYRGVTKRGKRYSARITVNGTTLHLGTCSCIEVAIEAYCRAARLHFGAFAPLDQLEDAWVG